MLNNRNTLLGLAVGDSLGMPYEMKEAKDIVFSSSYQPSEYHKLNAGQYTDDTQMSLALANSILENKEYNPESAAKYYLDWYEKGPRGIGGTIKEAMENLKKGMKWHQCGVVRSGYCGNGTAMRATPIGIAYRNATVKKIIEVTSTDSVITHVHDKFEAENGSALIAFSVASLLSNRCDLFDLYYFLEEELVSKFNEDSKFVSGFEKLYELKKTNPKEAIPILGTSGDVVETVLSALHCVIYHEDFENGVIDAVKAGGDTDSRASMVGAIIASYGKLTDIPDIWREGIEDYNLLVDTQNKLMELCLK